MGSKMFRIKIEDTGFLDKITESSNLKILTLKQKLQRLPIALAQAKSCSIFENLLNEIRYHIFFYRAKEITTKVYNNILSAIKLQYKYGNYIFMNFKNSEKSDPYRLSSIFNLTDEIDLRRKNKNISLSNLIHGKI